MSTLAGLQNEIQNAFQGHPDIVQRCLVAFLAKGHLLIEDEPGVGKTLLAQALAKALGLGFRRIQMTPDLLPADVTGGLLWIPNPGEYRFRPGPLFSNVVLLDELNRASAKTQSAVLQAMEEKKISVDGEDHELPPLFFVIGTQNPFESTGVNALPESQLDRFALKLNVGRLPVEIEKGILVRGDRDERLAAVRSLLSPVELAREQALAQAVTVSPAVLDHVMTIAEKLRGDRKVSLSTRALQSWVRLSQALAHLRGRDFVLPEDARDLAVQALAHRIRQAGNREAGKHVEETLRETGVF